MELLLQKFLSISFIVIPVFVIFWFSIKILRHLIIKKTINNLDRLPNDGKERIVRLYRRIISIQRISLWMTLFAFLLFLAVFVMLFVFPEVNSAFTDFDIRQFVLLGEILLIVNYIHLVEDSYYKKKILKAIDKPAEREIP